MGPRVLAVWVWVSPHPRVRGGSAWAGPGHPFSCPACGEVEKRDVKARGGLGITSPGHSPRPGRRPELPDPLGKSSLRLCPSTSEHTESHTLHPRFSSHNFLFEGELLSLSASGSRRRKSRALDSDPHMNRPRHLEAMPCGPRSPPVKKERVPGQRSVLGI